MSHPITDQMKDQAWDLACSWYDPTAPDEIVRKAADRIYQFMLDNEGHLPGRIIPPTDEQVRAEENRFINSFSDII